MRKILIIGRIPLPIGGITIHVSRLIEQLKQNGFERFSFCDPGREKWFKILCKILKYRTIHLHISDPFYQLSFAIFCKLACKRLLITYHGNWGRYGLPANWAVNASAWLSFVPIVQNEDSLKHARRWNRGARLISTYIPVSRRIPLSKDTHQKLSVFVKTYQTIFCTNAWDVTFDKYGYEIYGISAIIRSMHKASGLGLIVSDPSGNYSLFIKDSSGKIPDHVHFISEPHDFSCVLDFSDAFIRNTSTDGVSLSIYEAMEANVVILASDSVQRPAFCKVFHDISQIDWLEELNLGRRNLDLCERRLFLPDVIGDLTVLYNQCLQD